MEEIRLIRQQQGSQKRPDFDRAGRLTDHRQ
jgi:hypothetical protein